MQRLSIARSSSLNQYLDKALNPKKVLELASEIEVLEWEIPKAKRHQSERAAAIPIAFDIQGISKALEDLMPSYLPSEISLEGGSQRLYIRQKEIIDIIPKELSEKREAHFSVKPRGSYDRIFKLSFSSQDPKSPLVYGTMHLFGKSPLDKPLMRQLTMPEIRFITSIRTAKIHGKFEKNYLK